MKEGKVKDEQIQYFMNHYKKIVTLEDSFENLPIVDYGYHKTEKMVRYAIKQDMWIYEYFFLIDYPLLTRYQKIVESVRDVLETIKEESKKNHYQFDKEYYSLEVNSFINFYESNRSLFNIIYDRIFSLKIKNRSKLYSLISNISERNQFINVLLENLRNFFNNIKKENNDCYLTLTPFDICFESLRNISELKEFKSDFNNSIGKKLVNMTLQPQYRTNDNFLLELSQLLSIFDKDELDIKVTHIIGFMFQSKREEVIRKALFLCSKFNDDNLQHLGIIQEFFDREITLENFSPSILIDFCNFYPVSIKGRNFETLNFQHRVFDKYSLNTITKSYKSKLGELIISMMSVASPDRKEYNSFSMSDSSTIEETIGKQKFSFQPIPYFLWESNPNFWKLFDYNRSSINEIIEEQHEIVSSFKIFTEFPELFDFKLRMKYFRDKMNNLINEDEGIYITVKRSNILETSYKEIGYENMLDDCKRDKWFGDFDITFEDEEGVDAGGLKREWFTKLIQSFFNQEDGDPLFVPTGNEYCYQPNTKFDDNLQYFKFAGLVIARAIVEGLCIEQHFSLPFIKLILHRNVCFNDMQNYNVSMFNSFESILNTDIDNDPYSEYYFEATKVDSDGMETVQLVKGGENIRVTNENKKKYVHLMTQYYLKESIKSQLEAFSEGFDLIIKHQDARIFTSSEFELVICGVPKINVDDLKKNFIYEDGYNENTPVVVLFFQAISKWSQENLAKLLLFFTGTSKLPADGKTKEKLILGNGGERDNYPVAHTCSNKIDLPEYETEEELNEKFMLAINIESFDVA